MNAEERQMPPPRGQPPRAQQQPTPPRNRSRCTWALPAAPRQQSQQHTSASTPTSPSARSTPTLSAARQPDSVPSSPGGRRMAAVLGAYQSPSTVLRPTDAQPAVDSSWWYGHAHPSSPDSGVDIEAGSCLSAVQSRFVFPDITASSDREEVPHATASGASPTPGAPRAGGASSALVPTSPGGRRLAAVFNAPVATPGPSFSSPRAALHFAATTNGTPAATSSFSPSVSATSRPSPRSTWRTPTSCGAPAQPPETAPLFVQAGVDCERGSGLANNSLQLAEQAVVGAGAVAVCGDGAAHQESEADAFYDVPPDGVTPFPFSFMDVAGESAESVRSPPQSSMSIMERFICSELPDPCPARPSTVAEQLVINNYRSMAPTAGLKKALRTSNRIRCQSLLSDIDSIPSSAGALKENSNPLIVRKRRRRTAVIPGELLLVESPARKKQFVKACFVPLCKNNAATHPDLLYFYVPRNENARKEIHNLLTLAFSKKNYKGWKFSGGKYCCELHYELSNDLTAESFEIRAINGDSSFIKMKEGVIPHKLTRKIVCGQIVWIETRKSANETAAVIPPHATARRLELDLSQSSCHDGHLVEDKEDDDEWPEELWREPDYDSLRDRAAQIQRTVAEVNEDRISAASIVFLLSDPDYEPSTTVTEDTLPRPLSSERNKELLELRRNVTRAMMLEDPKLFLGIPAEKVGIIHTLAETVAECEDKIAPTKKNKISVSFQDRVLITLRKVRLNESFTLLARFFGLAKSTVSRVFRNTLPTLAACLAELIVRVPPERTLCNLPVAFRYEYSDVTDILDCLEVGVQASGDAAHRAITYSSYKGGTTLKFLVCITPDCFCTFMSRGYGGRISDLTLTKDCGYLDLLTEKHSVMADRGFKGLAPTLDLIDVKLIRPPSISKGQAMSESDCTSTTKVASLRIHVERFINKMRFFHFVSPHANVHVSLIPYVEMAATISAALVNLGNPLINEEGIKP